MSDEPTAAPAGSAAEMYLAEARAFFARSRAQGGPGVTAEDLAKLLFTVAEAAKGPSIAEAASLRAQLAGAQEAADKREASFKEQLAVALTTGGAEHKLKKHREPKGPLVDPKVGVKPTPENIDAILANTL